jgi:FtsP/CotA-like multicopper oxidase with cupredoxin domain
LSAAFDNQGIMMQHNAKGCSRREFRSRCESFKDGYVLHCHMLADEDMGMMQAVELV